MTILVDMDDVIEQLVVGWVEYVNEMYGTHAIAADVHDWDMSKGLLYIEIHTVHLTRTTQTF